MSQDRLYNAITGTKQTFGDNDNDNDIDAP